MSQNKPEVSKSMEDAALALYYRAAEMIKSGLSPEEVEQRLIESGIRADVAHTIITRLGQARINVTRRAGWRNLTVGVVLMLLALSLPVVDGDPGRAALIIALALIAAAIGLFWIVRGVQQIKVG